uniref:Protein KRI1 homolog n=1 Tax=Meloidogyne floridensis TaxID=298350 RepID=A0A915NXY7_9BILA
MRVFRYSLGANKPLIQQRIIALNTSGSRITPVSSSSSSGSKSNKSLKPSLIKLKEQRREKFASIMEVDEDWEVSKDGKPHCLASAASHLGNQQSYPNLWKPVHHEKWSLNDEKDFLRTLGALKSRDPEIYQTEVKFFKEKEKDEHGKKKSNESSKNNSTKNLQQSKMTLKEYEQKLIIERGGKLSEDEEEEEKNGEICNEELTNGLNKNDWELKNEFKKALISDDESDDDGDFIQKKIIIFFKAKEDEDFYEWIKGSNQMEVEDKHLKKLKERWTKNDQELGEDERFLRDFLLNKKYLGDSKEEEKGKEERIPTYEEIIKDEQEEDLADQFEQKYNFRFEEPDQEFESKRHKKLEEEKEAKKRKRTHVEMVEVPFRYRQVPPNSFGLSTDEILNSDDRCLNAWAPLSKICQYRDDTEEQKQILYFERKAKNIEKKRKILEKKLKSTSNNIVGIKSKTTLKGPTIEQEKIKKEPIELNQEKIVEKLNEEQQRKSKKRKLMKINKKENKKKNKKQFNVTELNKERLKAYGVGTIKKLKSIQFCKKMDEK